MSLFRAAAWRKHPLFQYKLQHVLIGLPTGIGMFAAVTAAESAGILTYKDSDPKKYEFVSAVHPAPKEESHGGHH